MRLEPDAYGVKSSHFAQGCPSPLGHFKTCEAIALRNARELAESFQHFDFDDDHPWPRDDIFEYGPSTYWLAGADVYADRLTGKWAPADDGKRAVWAESEDEDYVGFLAPGEERPVRNLGERSIRDADDIDDLYIDLDQ